MKPLRANGYDTKAVYYGDLHNHCGLSYGHGPLAAALHNARLQLDFASVTIHAAWPDVPVDDPELLYLVNYHSEGFERAEKAWPEYLAAMDKANDEGDFVTFPSFEWHSMRYGDHCVYYQDGAGGEAARPIIRAEDLTSLRRAAKSLHTPVFVIPHHIGYRQGYRGINWSAFHEELSPVVEIFSFHGLSESSEGPYPYLHSMGPRHGKGTAQYGWQQGHVFGVVGSTDHHNAFPGSYGYGRLAVWASDLSRDAIWSAIARRCTYALTGERIDVAFSVNGRPMGEILDSSDERWIEVAVRGSSAIDYVEVLHNNRVIHRENRFAQHATGGRFTVALEVGWGERTYETCWDVTVQIAGGRLLGVEPHLRGIGPTASPAGDANFMPSSWEQDASGQVSFQTRTRPNLSLHTPSVEGMALDIEGDATTQLVLTANGQEFSLPLAEIMSGARTFYLGGFVSPALCVHRAVPESESAHRFAFLHRSRSPKRDWYTVRVRQHNDQWAWTSPIWIAGRDV